MKAALLIGNGLNRCYEDNDSQISWSSLLQKIAKDDKVPFNDSNSFPLEYECLVNSICEKRNKSGKPLHFDAVLIETKTAIAEQVEAQFPPLNSIHHRFMNLPIDEIMTTNYDYVLERTFSPNISLQSIKASRVVDKNNRAETKYSLKRKLALSQKIFHHIHGEANDPDSLCLGYGHYADSLTKIRDYVKGQVRVSNGSISTFSKNSAELSLAAKRWCDLFFTHDVHIVGLTLDVCEIDLWWLLTYRAQLFHSNSGIKNEITLYSTKDRSSNEYAMQKALFERLHVNVVSVPPQKDVSGKPDYLSAYKSICGMIEDIVLQRHII